MWEYFAEYQLSQRCVSKAVCPTLESYSYRGNWSLYLQAIKSTNGHVLSSSSVRVICIHNTIVGV